MATPGSNPIEVDLSGRVAVVTGGSRGLGLEMARAFARAGASVLVASRKGEVCAEVARALAEETGSRCEGATCHVGRWEDCDALAAQAFERFGRVDILVNNAGMSPLYESLTSVTEALYDKVLAVNLRGPFRLSALFGERMKRDGRGAILNISSIAAVQPTPRELPYAAAKAGLNALTLGLARALAPEVRVNALLAGPFLTDISRAWNGEAFRRAAEQHIPLRRAGEPGEIVGAALYLVSDAASYTTGAILKVDGGAAWTPA